MVIVSFIFFLFFFYQVLITLLRKDSLDEHSTLHRKRLAKLVASFLLWIVLTMIGCSLMQKRDTSIMNREYIPIHLKEFKVMYVTDDSNLYFDDGYGNIYWIPRSKIKNVEVFKDSDLKLTSVEKVTEKTSISTPAKIISDFGLFTNNFEITTEYYEFCIPESKLVPITPISEADLHPVLDEVMDEVR